MKISSLFVSLAVIMLSLGNCRSNQAASDMDTIKQPNIILLIGDDQGYPYFGFMGAEYVQTPNLDSLAKNAYLFTNGYVPDNHCRPSLQTLLTGMLPADYNRAVDSLMQEKMAGIRFDSEPSLNKWKQDFRYHAMQYFETLPVLLGNEGYKSFQGGKWWEYHYENGGFSHGMTTGWTPKDKESGSLWFKKFMGGDGLALARATMEPVYEFIDSSRNHPFFIWYAPELPHYPFDAPAKYYDLYKDKEMTESAKRYYANCTWFDDGVGALVDYLEKKNLLENTLIIYVNDNGWEQNPDQEFRHDSLRWHNGGDKGKLSVYDQSYRTPVFFYWKDHIPAKRNSTALIESADIPATLMHFTGIDEAPRIHGRSLRSLLESNEESFRSEIIGNSTKMRSEEDYMGKDINAYWLRNQQWFFRWLESENEVALYDMHIDPNNENNVAREHPEIVQNLKRRINEWRAVHE
jgi:arylsulfatase A-like enzyme